MSLPIALANRLKFPTMARNLATSASRGTLGGGFSRDNLAEWTKRNWGDANGGSDETGGHYVDLLSHKISARCAAMLEKDSHPSSTVCRAFYQSKAFTPERWLASTFKKNNELPLVFKRDVSYLFWTTADASPHEVILSWKLGPSRGCTMLAVDPRQRLVYLGSGIQHWPGQDGFLFRRILLPFHVLYSNLLIKSMVQELENSLEDKKE